jgi:hypothetical protein
MHKEEEKRQRDAKVNNVKIGYVTGKTIRGGWRRWAKRKI